MINIIVLGADFSGTMAGSQRISNLFEPLLQKETLGISNLIISKNTKTESSNQAIIFKKIKYKK